jgi:glutamine amidotransferase
MSGPRVAVVDYKAGNLTSLLKGLTAAGADAYVTAEPADLRESCDGIVIPGVGHFAATTAIDAELRSTIRGCARDRTPVLGICLGLQFLFAGSEEAPELEGLALLPGRCALLKGDDVKVPHVGWNTVSMRRPSVLLEGIGDHACFYFTHSYAAPIGDAAVGVTAHGSAFAAIVDDGRDVFGVQFHPEKSGEDGLRLLRNFVSRC